MLFDDQTEIKRRYKKRFGVEPNLSVPTTFNEKILHRILFEKNHLFTEYSDKLLVRNYISDVIGDEYLIPLIAKYSDANDINFDQLPDKCVLKCNHDSGSVVIFDKNKNQCQNLIRKKLNSCLSTNYYNCTREWQYKDIKPFIICEEFISDNDEAPKDYKFHVFNCDVNNPKIFVQCDSDRYIKHTRNFYNKNWELLPFRLTYENSVIDPKPHNLELMVKLVKLLSKDFNYVRVDFYEVNNKIYFGEMTFTAGSGLEVFYPNSWDSKLGSLWVN